MMNSANAILMGALTRKRERKVFDWCEAARIIKNHPGCTEAWAGLKGDFENTSGVIYSNREIVGSGNLLMYLASTWATPVIRLYFGSVDDEFEEEDEDEWDEDAYIEFPCYLMETETEWNEHTIWPDEAKDIIGG